MSQRVTIIGPNLQDQSKGSFHVHAEGCGDIRRRYTPWENDDAWTIEADSIQDVVTAVYEDIMYENEDTWEAYESDFHVCPCVTVPRTA